MKTHDYLTRKIANLEALRKLKTQVDPASGMTVRIRRGPMSQDEGDCPREWIEVETGFEMATIIDGLIKCEVDSLKFWKRVAQGELVATQEALAAALKVKLDETP